jgi:hypothetical protein
LPPQPSSAPHALPAQVGVQPHTPGFPPPPQASGGAHELPQQACPLPPHTPHVTPHVAPPAHAVHAAPPLPHAALSSPTLHVLPSQHPPQEATSHLHAPATHLVPDAHAPWVQTKLQPSLAPHGLPSQLGVHEPAPHTFGVPAPPQSCPIEQPPQSTRCAQASRIWPHLPAQTTSGGWHDAPSPPASAAEPSVVSSDPRSAEHPATSPKSDATTKNGGRGDTGGLLTCALGTWEGTDGTPRSGVGRAPAAICGDFGRKR